MFKKKYEHYPVIKQVLCEDPTHCKMLRWGVYDVIDSTDTEYLIRFKSGGTNWYDIDRFVRIIPEEELSYRL